MTCTCTNPANSHHHLLKTIELLYAMACILLFVAPALLRHKHLNLASHLVSDYAGSMTDGMAAGVSGSINALT